MSFRYAPFNITQFDMAARVLELQLTAYPVEAKHIGLETIPPMLDSINSLRACGEHFIGCFENEDLIGAVSYKLEGTLIDIHRMMVHPGRFRQGIGQELLNAALSIPGVENAIVSTGSANSPAVRLYERNGFRETGRREIAPGVTISMFRREMPVS